MSELDVYQALATPASVADLSRLRRRVLTHLEVMEEQSFTHELLELELARQIAAALVGLIEGAHAYSGDQRALLHGAIAYFLKTDDAEDDIHSPIGMQDDGRVVNALCQEFGRADLILTLP